MALQHDRRRDDPEHGIPGIVHDMTPDGAILSASEGQERRQMGRRSPLSQTSHGSSRA